MLAGDKTQTQTWVKNQEEKELGKYVDVSGRKNMIFFFREMFAG
jgi:hypothetical protein